MLDYLLLINVLAWLTPYEQSVAAKQLVYLMGLFIIIGVLVAYLGSIRRWQKQTLMIIGALMVGATMMAGGVILQAPWWYILLFVAFGVVLYLVYVKNLLRLARKYRNHQ